MVYSFNTPAKVIGILHAMFGGFLILFGIVARLQVHHWTSIMLIGIWTGALIMFTGAVAVIGSYRRMDMPPKRCFVVWFVILSFIAILMAAMVVVCYTFAVMSFFDIENIGEFDWWDYDLTFRIQSKERAQAISCIILIFGCLEFINAVISLIHGLACCCLKKWHKQQRMSLKETDMRFNYINRGIE